MALEFASGEETFHQIDTNVFSVVYGVEDYKKMEFLWFCYSKDMAGISNLKIIEQWTEFEDFREHYNNIMELNDLREKAKMILLENEDLRNRMNKKYKMVRNKYFYHTEEFSELYNKIYTKLLEDGEIETRAYLKTQKDCII